VFHGRENEHGRTPSGVKCHALYTSLGAIYLVAWDLWLTSLLERPVMFVDQCVARHTSIVFPVSHVDTIMWTTLSQTCHKIQQRTINFCPLNHNFAQFTRSNYSRPCVIQCIISYLSFPFLLKNIGIYIL